MSSTAPRGGEDRVFVREGRRHYRRTYSATEIRIGVVILCTLAVLVGWVAWRGAHPDPALFSDGTELLLAAAPPAERTPLPDGLTRAGWSEGAVSRFDAGNLYEKINGREDYYKSFGFEELVFLSLAREEDPAVAVDIECFDLGSAENALGAYSGERAPEIVPAVDAGGLSHLDRNSLFLTRGRYYVRVIGSEESPAVTEELEHLRGTLRESIPGEDLPWGFALFAGSLGLDPGQVAYTAEGAFSFGFANDVYSALLPDGETELFVQRTPGPEAARELAARYRGGFLELGTEAGSEGGVTWIRDRYIATIAGATVRGSWVAGVRGAPDIGTAREALDRLAGAVAAFTREGG